MQPDPFNKEGKLAQLLYTKWSWNCCFGLQYIASVTTTHHVSCVDIAGPSTECSSAVNASIPVEPSISSGCLYSQWIDDNEITFDFPLEELQMKNRELNISKHTSDAGC